MHACLMKTPLLMEQTIKPLLSMNEVRTRLSEES